jgi:hypothetical protein
MLTKKNIVVWKAKSDIACMAGFNDKTTKKTL